MAERKYDNLFTTEIIRETVYPPFKNMIMHLLEKKDFNFQIRFTHVSVPFEGNEPAHSHDFAQVMLFVPCTDDLTAYDAETWLYLGDEGEKYVVNRTTAVFLPAGLVHCPIIHKRVGTPFFFVNVPLAPEYTRLVDGKEAADTALKVIPQNKGK